MIFLLQDDCLGFIQADADKKVHANPFQRLT